MGLADFHPRYFSVTERSDIAVVKFGVSHLNDEENIEDLGHELFALVDQYACNKIVLNMSEVEYITSSVVGKMITMHRKLHRNNGLFVVCELTPGVTEVLAASRLLSYFTHTATEAEAIVLAQPNEGGDDETFAM